MKSHRKKFARVRLAIRAACQAFGHVWRCQAPDRALIRHSLQILDSDSMLEYETSDAQVDCVIDSRVVWLTDDGEVVSGPWGEFLNPA